VHGATYAAKFACRKFYQHNPQVTLMRTTPEECQQLGKILAAGRDEAQLKRAFIEGFKKIGVR
jgi:uncharacterized protein (UPF0261 family)